MWATEQKNPINMYKGGVNMHRLAYNQINRTESQAENIKRYQDRVKLAC